MRPGCDREGAELAARSVQAAAQQALAAACAAPHAPHARRLVAIDLTGPIVVSGACTLGYNADRATDERTADRHVVIGAYARVTYSP